MCASAPRWRNAAIRGVCSPMSDSVKPTTLMTAVRFTSPDSRKNSPGWQSYSWRVQGLVFMSADYGSTYLRRNPESACFFIGFGKFRVGCMKSKQLANVLIKIIGLYVCLCAIPELISGILALFPSIFTPTSGVPQFAVAKFNDILFRTFAWAIGAAVRAVVGI
jgi:hypothetical protein